MFKDEKHLIETLEREYNESAVDGRKSFRRVVADPKYKGLPAGTASTILKEREVPVKWLKAIGIYNLALAEICKTCGIVHTRRTCPNLETGRKRNRRSINLGDPSSARDTIVNSGVPLDYIEDLVDDLAAYLIMKG